MPTRNGSTRAGRKLRLLILARDGWRCMVPVDEHGYPTEDGSGTPHGIALTTHDPTLPTHAHDDHIDGDWTNNDPANHRASCLRCNERRSAATTNRMRKRPLNASREW